MRNGFKRVLRMGNYLQDAYKNLQQRVAEQQRRKLKGL